MLLLFVLLAALVAALASCGGDFVPEISGQNEQSVSAGESIENSEADSKDATSVNESVAAGETSDLIKKVRGASEEAGMYAFQMILSDEAADRGSLEYIFYGPKGSAQDGEVVCTFVGKYFKESAGTYDITTYSNGDIELHRTGCDELKIACEFGAAIRAGSVVAFYTPEDGETIEIYRADAEQFLPG